MMCRRVLSVLLLTTLCCGQVAVRGTVVVVVPSNAGVVIASDTRTIVKGKTCDGHTKIFDPKLRKNTVVFYTGNGNQVSDPANGIDICQHVEKSTPVLDITKFLTNQANLLPDTLLTIPELQRIATRCLDLVTLLSYSSFGSRGGRRSFSRCDSHLRSGEWPSSSWKNQDDRRRTGAGWI